MTDSNYLSKVDSDKFIRTKTSFCAVCDAMRMDIPVGLNKNELSVLEKEVFRDAPKRQELTQVYRMTPNKKGVIPQIKRKPFMMI
jgi:hypothetical protein